MNHLTTFILSVIFFAGFLADTSFAQTETDSVAILQQTERWVEAAREENVEALTAIYADDAVMLPPGAPPIEGKANIRALFADQFARLDATFQFFTEELVVADSWAYRWGNYELTAEVENGETAQFKDKFIEIWKLNESGDWVISRDIWNRTEPGSQ